MWSSFNFLHMKIWRFIKFLHMWSNLMGFYCNLCRFVAKTVIHADLSQNLFCHKLRHNLRHNLRAFMWRKFEPKGSFVEKIDKYQVWMIVK